MKQSKVGTLSGLKVKGFEGLDLSAILKSTALQIGFGKYSLLGAMKYLIKRIIFDTEEYYLVGEEEGNKVLFMCVNMHREDHKKTGENFVKLVGGMDGFFVRDIPPKMNRHILSDSGTVIYWFLIFSIQKRIRFSETIVYLSALRECRWSKRVLEDVVKFERYRMGISYFDADALGSMWQQIFSMNQLVTATLQHGMFAKKEKPTDVNETGIEFMNSGSDWFLAWNSFSFDNAVAAGMDPHKIKILGIPKSVNKENEDFHELQAMDKNTNSFGVILNVGSLEGHNRRLLHMAKCIAEAYHMECIVKYHPGMNGNEYESLTKQIWKCRVVERKCTTKEFADMVSFSVASESSMYVELICLRHPIYRLRLDADDKFARVDMGSFQTLEELSSLREDNTLRQKLYGYFCCEGDVKKNYVEFIKEHS